MSAEAPKQQPQQAFTAYVPQKKKRNWIGMPAKSLATADVLAEAKAQLDKTCTYKHIDHPKLDMSDNPTIEDYHMTLVNGIDEKKFDEVKALVNEQKFTPADYYASGVVGLYMKDPDAQGKTTCFGIMMLNVSDRLREFQRQLNEKYVLDPQKRARRFQPHVSLFYAVDAVLKDGVQKPNVFGDDH